MINILAIEAATPACSVALSVDGIVSERHEVAPRRHTSLLFSYIDELLQTAGLSISDIDLIACGVGPGSFMGVRLAVSVVQGLAFSKNIPVMGLSTLQILAQEAFLTHQLTHATVMWDARMQEVYLGEYELNPQGLMMPCAQDRLIKPENFASSSSSVAHVVGNGWQAYQSNFPLQLSQKVQVYEGDYPRARAMIPLALAGYAANQQIEASALRPLYLRQPV